MEDDLLQKMLILQKNMQNKYYPQIQNMRQEDQLLINTRALIHETIEVENELNWKHWKIPIFVDKEKVKEEIVDQFIFLMNEINIVEMDSGELFDRTLNKISVNIDRQKSGY